MEKNMMKCIAWLVIIVGVLWLLPLLGVTLGPWAGWVIAIATILIGVKLLMCCKGGKK